MSYMRILYSIMNFGIIVMCVKFVIILYILYIKIYSFNLKKNFFFQLFSYNR